MLVKIIYPVYTSVFSCLVYFVPRTLDVVLLGICLNFSKTFHFFQDLLFVFEKKNDILSHMTSLIFFIALIVILLFSVIIHEVAHGSAALYLGDPTAKDAGRLTLNPLRHLDPIGSIMVPLFLILMARLTGGGIIFGWAKPVPINPYNFRDQKYGQAKVALAGPGANLLLAIIFGATIRFIPMSSSLFFQNLASVFALIVWINLLLGIFNLLPIPPLDGSHILFTFLPYSAQQARIFFAQYGFLLLLVFIFFLFPLIIPVINFLFWLLTGTDLQFI